MGVLLTRGLAALIVSLLLFGPVIAAETKPAPTAGPKTALSADSKPDRSTLSYDENVTINTACFLSRKQGDSAFDRCVRTQLAALRDHPSPDRSGLSAPRNRQIDYACGYYRRLGIAAFNDCLSKELTRRETSPDIAVAEADLKPDFVAAIKSVAENPPSVVPVAMTTVSKPASVLPKLPMPVEGGTLAGRDLFAKVKPSIYVILAAVSFGDFRAGRYVQGSAVAVTEHLVLTNCHVVNDRPFIRLFFDRVPAEATLIAADRAGDRCVLKTDAITLSPVAGVRPSSELREGDRVFTVGAPRGLQHTLSEGLISGFRSIAGENLMQITAPVSPGSSGGGLFDEHGNLIGITTLASLPGSQNINCAIAASDFWQ